MAVFGSQLLVEDGGAALVAVRVRQRDAAQDGADARPDSNIAPAKPRGPAGWRQNLGRLGPWSYIFDVLLLVVRGPLGGVLVRHGGEVGR